MGLSNTIFILVVSSSSYADSLVEVFWRCVFHKYDKNDICLSNLAHLKIQIEKEVEGYKE